MKSLLLSALVSFSFSALAETKICNVELQNPESEAIEIYRYTLSNTEAVVTSEGQEPETYPVRQGDYVIKEGITSDMLMDDETLNQLNKGEKLIAMAIFYAEKPELDDMDVGIDLSKIRRVKTHFIGNDERDMSTTLIDAMDADGKLLGTFMGGILPRPCK